jgi:hypothetical protein
MDVLIGLDCLLEPGDHRAKGILLVEPMGKKMYAHTRETRCDADELRARGHRRLARPLARASLATIAPPLSPPAVEMADTHRQRYLLLNDLVTEHAAWTLGVLMEQGPQQGLLHFTQLASSTKGWTGTLITVTLARGEWHDIILLNRHCRMKSAHPPLWVNGHFYPQQNQSISAKSTKSCQKSVIFSFFLFSPFNTPL